MKTAILITSILLLTTNVNAAVKRHIKVHSVEVKEYGSVTKGYSVSFKTSVRENRSAECKIWKSDGSTYTRKFFMQPKQKHHLSGTGEPPRKIKCWYWLK